MLVAPGTYKANINFNGKAITLKSSGGTKVTIIDGGGVGPVVTFSMNEKSTSVVEDFTFQDGTSTFDSPYEGGGIYVSFHRLRSKTTLSRTTRHVPREPASELIVCGRRSVERQWLGTVLVSSQFGSIRARR